MAPRSSLAFALGLLMVAGPAGSHEFHHHGGWHHGSVPHFWGGQPPIIVGSAPIYVVSPPPVYIVSNPAPPIPPPWPIPAAPAANPQPVPPPAKPVAKPRRSDPARAEKLVELGDHLFRSGNLSRALERYQQAARADTAGAEAFVRLAQVALVRGKYAEAADAFRKAEIAQPGWLAHARDIQALYVEPADFARQVAKLESHLQAHPDDRDAWFVLGANWYLSGRTRKAADVFLRLSDRKVDSSLDAFLDASAPADR